MYGYNFPQSNFPGFYQIEPASIWGLVQASVYSSSIDYLLNEQQVQHTTVGPFLYHPGISGI